MTDAPAHLRSIAYGMSSAFLLVVIAFLWHRYVSAERRSASIVDRVRQYD